MLTNTTVPTRCEIQREYPLLKQWLDRAIGEIIRLTLLVNFLPKRSITVVLLTLSVLKTNKTPAVTHHSVNGDLRDLGFDLRTGLKLTGFNLKHQRTKSIVSLRS